ncbi:MAG TPA: hypothetical protein VFL61_11180 [Gaiellaceae bacterium]|nr:hypothetical protein [Gaiellaceae bacterium]
MPERRDLGEKPRLDRLAGRKAFDWPLGVDQQLDGLEAGRERRLDEVFALTTEQAQALALTTGSETADEP